jgi:hypothetical protein
MNLSNYSAEEATFAYPMAGNLIATSTQQDVRNRLHLRNEDNVKTRSFNCGGYALETFNWFLPIVTQDFISEHAEEKWLIQNGYEACWEIEDESDKEKELCDYIDIKVQAGEEEILKLLEEIEIPDNIGPEEAKAEALELYKNHCYNSPIALSLVKGNLLKTFSDLRVIKDWGELKNDEYGIAYRGGPDDFHFIKYDQKEKLYTHKLGWQFIETLISLEDGFGDDYNSKTIFFAKKCS